MDSLSCGLGHRVMCIAMPGPAVKLQCLLCEAAALKHMIWGFVFRKREGKEVAKYVQLDANLE